MTTFTIPTLETERLILRAPDPSDFEAYAVFNASEQTKGVGGPYSRQQAFTRICTLVGHWQMRGFGRWMIADRETNAPLGVSGLYFPEDWPEPEIAWTVFAEAEGKGIAFEAATRARQYAYETMGWTTVISCVMADNTRSLALAERMGCTYEGVFTHEEFGELGIWRHPGPDA
jgi:ribosomal-protein-alanine N-acetyltransferase